MMVDAEACRVSHLPFRSLTQVLGCNGALQIAKEGVRNEKNKVLHFLSH